MVRLISFSFFLLTPCFIFAQAPELPPRVMIPGDSLKISAGMPLSDRTLVLQPKRLPTGRSWTWETKYHRWAVLCLAVSPDGKIVATGGYDGMIRLWERDTGKFVKILVGHNSYVRDLAWSPDGQTLASAGTHDGTARLWDRETGLPLKILRKHKGYVTHVTWHPEGKMLVTGGGSSGFITYWDLMKGEQIRTDELGTDYSDPIYSPDGKVLMIPCPGGVALFDATTGKNFQTLEIEAVAGRAIALSPDGKKFAVGGTKSISIFQIPEISTEAQYVEMQKLPAAAECLVWLKNGDLITSDITTVQLWKGDEKFVKGANFPATVYAMEHVRGTDEWVAGNYTNFSPATGAVTALATSHPVGSTPKASWKPGFPIISDLGTNTPKLCDPMTGKTLFELPGHTAAVTCVDWHMPTKTLVTGSNDKTARVWDYQKGTELLVLKDHSDRVTSVAFSPDGRIATGSADRQVRIYPAKKSTPTVLTGHIQPITALAWGKGGILASGGSSGNVLIWNVAAGKSLKTLEAMNGINSMEFAANGMLATGCDDFRLRLWNIPRGAIEKSLDDGGRPPAVNAVAFNPTGTQIAAGRAKHRLNVWDVQGARLAIDLPTNAPIQDVAWSVDGKTIISSCLDRSIRVWTTAPVAGLQTTIVVEKNQLLIVSTTGDYRVSDLDDSELMAVVLTDQGMETLTPKEFALKYRLRNTPTLVKVPLR
ncbi:MAG: WD40 repeat domain-containing protein [Zavarzinella sp.]